MFIAFPFDTILIKKNPWRFTAGGVYWLGLPMLKYIDENIFVVVLILIARVIEVDYRNFTLV